MSADALAWALSQPTGTRERDLAEAISLGAVRVRHEGREIEYRSADEMMETLARLYAVAQSSSARRPGVTFARFNGGGP